MDLIVLAPEPHVLPPALALLLLGVLGYPVARRWRWAVALIMPCAVLLAWRIAVGLLSVREAAAHPDLRNYVLPAFVVGGLAMTAGLGLPLAGWRQASRPAP
jgi:hypothetical protein